MKRIVLLVLGLVSLGTDNLRSQTMEKLDSRQHSIVVIAANTATGNLDMLKTALNEGLAGVYVFCALADISNNVYVLLSMIMLIGLLGKNVVLIVEYAVQRRRQG